MFLARLQHTHIMPLLFAQEFPERNLLALAEPYLGTTTLGQLLDGLKDRPVHQRHGRDILELLDRAAATRPITLTAHGPERNLLENSTYVEAICLMAIHLAEALHYAHQRGVVHLDLKPSNILVGIDGQPLILDFDVARSALAAGEPAPSWLGGTPGYVSPEQQAALEAVPRQAPIPTPLDGRSDLYSLGVVLCEALDVNVSPLQTAAAPAKSLPANEVVSVGLGDIVRKCLEASPNQRYASAGRLADDLKRHLSHQPLRWAGNRSVRERWQKWRRRRPYHLPLYLALAFLGATAGAAAWMEWYRLGDQHRAAEQALFEAQSQLGQGQFADAERSLNRGRELAEQLPGSSSLVQAMDHRLQLARRGRQAQDLHALVEQLHFFAIEPAFAPARLHVIDAGCRNIWDMRHFLSSAHAGELEMRIEKAIDADLRDLALLWPELRLHLAGGHEKSWRDAWQILGQAEELFGPSVVFRLARGRHGQALGLANPPSKSNDNADPGSAWGHLALARHWLHTEKWQRADHHLAQARLLEPTGFLVHLYDGVSAHRQGKFARAAVAYSVCVGQAPRPESFYFRALAFAALGQEEQALADLKQALELNRNLAAPALERGRLWRRQGRWPEALAEIGKALQVGASPAKGYFELALVQRELRDLPGARKSLETVLLHDPHHPEARKLLQNLDN